MHAVPDLVARAHDLRATFMPEPFELDGKGETCAAAEGTALPARLETRGTEGCAAVVREARAAYARRGLLPR